MKPARAEQTLVTTLQGEPSTKFWRKNVPRRGRMLGSILGSVAVNVTSDDLSQGEHEHDEW